MISGFLNLNKPQGLTSNKAIQVLRGILKKNGLDVKVGHLGTLDPMASGVLPVAINRATRLFDYVVDKEKAYRAEFIFGADSATLDTDSDVTFFSGVSVNEDGILSVLPSFIGEYDQIPPIFSAKSVNGVRAYDLARKGIEVELKPKKVRIYDLKLLERVGENRYRFDIVCGGGTYIRALGRDIAAKLGTKAVMSSLIRTKSGVFDIENALTLEQFREKTEYLSDLIVPLETPLPHFSKIIVKEEKKLFKLKNGLHVDIKRTSDETENTFLYENDKLLGISARDNEGLLYIKTWLI